MRLSHRKPFGALCGTPGHRILQHGLRTDSSEKPSLQASVVETSGYGSLPLGHIDNAFRTEYLGSHTRGFFLRWRSGIHDFKKGSTGKE